MTSCNCLLRRQQFAERLEVISYPERKRRATVGYVLLVRTHIEGVSECALHCVELTVNLVSDCTCCNPHAQAFRDSRLSLPM